MRREQTGTGHAVNLTPDASRRAPLASRLCAPYRALRSHIDRWLFQLRGTESGNIVLVQRRIFILPSRHGLLYMLALLVMLTGSVNYNLSLGFVLTFLLAALGINSILHTFRNLVRLEISPGRAQSVFAGDNAHFTLVLKNPGAPDRFSIGVTHDRNDVVYVDVPAQQAVNAMVAVPAPRRGILMPGRLTLFTHYPLGLCYAWSYVQPDMRCLVYPRPETAQIALPLSEAHTGTGVEYGSGQEDFHGLRSYHPGDSPRHIAWKATARGQGLLTKQFSGRADAELWLDWRMLPTTLDIEARLSRLARWVIDAHAAELSFGLRLPRSVLPPAPGDAQRDRCLEALALFESGNAAHDAEHR